MTLELKEDQCLHLVRLLDKAIELLPPEKRGLGNMGGFFRVCDAQTGESVFSCAVGVIPEEELPPIMKFSAEKARRLATHATHETSWESRDVENECYGGAVRVRRHTFPCILSFSGLPEEYDEALMLALAYTMRLMTAEEIFVAAHNLKLTKQLML